MNESQKALQLRIMAAHLQHDAEEWDRLARDSKYKPFGAKISYSWLKYYL
jgi:general transcription factor 3C polypeptide 3 (transcription factor C subunit 4)